MQILKFKTKPTDDCVNHLNGPLMKQNFTLTGSVLCVSVFQGSLLVIVMMIDGSEKCNCEGGF